MADAMEGIMGLPQSNGPATASANELAVIESYAQNNPKEFNSKLFEAMGEADPQLIMRLRSELQGLQLTVEELEALRQIIQDILMNPGDYQAIRQEMIDSGFDAEDLPEQFDGAYFQAFAIVLNQLEGTANPVEMAEGGLATLNPIAQAMQDMGRNGDTILAHINPQEAMVLKEMGGSGTINPATGLREYGFGSFFKAVTKPFRSAAKAVSKVFKSVTKAVKDVLASPVGRIIATIGLTMALGPAGLNLAGGLGATGSIALGINTAAASTIVGVASGQSFGDALKAGVVSGVMAGVGGEIFGVPEGYNTEAAGLQASGATTAGTGAPVSGPTELTTLAPGTDALGNAIPQADLGNYINQGGMTFDEGLGFLTPDEVMTQATMANAPVNMASYGPSSMMAEPAATFSTSTAPSQMADLTGGATIAPTSANAANYTAGITTGTPAPSQLTQAAVTPPTTTVTPPVSNVPLNAPVPAATPPSFTDTMSTAWDQATQGNLADAGSTLYDNLLSPSENIFTGSKWDAASASNAQDIYTKATGLQYTSNTPTVDPNGWKAAVEASMKAAEPGILSTIGSWAPLAVAGTGVAAGLGAFETPPPPDLPEWAKGPTGAELLAQDPEKYGLNWGGVRTTYADLYNKGYSGYGSPDNPYTAAMRGYTQPTYAANGGEMTSFPRMNGHISGPGTGTSDDVPAMLSDGEFVMTANAVRGAGNGSRRAGAKKMYALMKALENRTA